MQKQKQLRKIVLDKLYLKKKSQLPYHNLKKSTRSNAPTQSTPNQPKNKNKQIASFFQNFESQCAIIYQSVVLLNKKPLNRNLQKQLTQLDQHLRFKTQAFYQQENVILKGTKSKKQYQISDKQNLKNRLNTDYCFKNLSTNNSFCDIIKSEKNSFDFMRNKSSIIKKIPKQSQNSSYRIYQNKNSIVSSSNISKYNSPSKRIKTFSRVLSKKNISQIQLHKREESGCKQMKIEIQVKNAPKKLVNSNYNHPQKIKRVQSLRQFNNCIKKGK